MPARERQERERLECQATALIRAADRKKSRRPDPPPPPSRIPDTSVGMGPLCRPQARSRAERNAARNRDQQNTRRERFATDNGG